MRLAPAKMLWLPLATREWCGPVPSFDLAFRGGKTALFLFLFTEGGSGRGGSILTPLKVKFRRPLCNLHAAQTLLYFSHLTKQIFTLYLHDGGINSSLIFWCFTSMHSLNTFTMTLASKNEHFYPLLNNKFLTII